MSAALPTDHPEGDWCPTCRMEAKEREAEAGLRCQQCLGSTVADWEKSVTTPGFCRKCRA